jgi:uncharacterized protein (TIGR03435 family)
LVSTVAASSAAQEKSSQAAQDRFHAEQVRAEPVGLVQGRFANEVRITPTTKKALISEIFEIDGRRIDFAEDGTTDSRWDVVLQLPRDVEEDTMQEMLQSALERKFSVKIAAEVRTMDVYVLTAPNGPGAGLHRHGRGGSAMLVAGRAGQAEEDSGTDDLGQITYVGRDCSGVVSAGGIEALASAMADFRRTLEPELDRVLVDETNLTGSYDFKIGSYADQAELFQLMQQQLGIVVTKAQRRVPVLTVKPAQEMRAAL